MSQYLCIFGRTPVLSEAELYNYAGTRGGLSVKEAQGEIALIETNQLPTTLAKDLAGTIKTAEVIAATSRPKNNTTWVEQLRAAILQKPEALTFGISWYGANKLLPGKDDQQRIAMSLKKLLREGKAHVRFIDNKGAALSSAQIEGHHLLKSGQELIVWIKPNDIIIARTAAVQPLAEWSNRDMGRPRRNAKRGMLPPKLAHLMVNLAGGSISGTLLDPFCGVGTVLMEAAMLGWQNVVGSDKEKMAMHDTEQNIIWLREQYPLPKFASKLITSPVELIANKLPESSCAAIVTEPYLGAPLDHQPTIKEVAYRQHELEPIYRALLNACARLLTPRGRAVFILPHWRSTDGFEKTLPIEDGLPKNLKRLELLPNQPLKYQRDEQFVIREIVVLEKQG